METIKNKIKSGDLRGVKIRPLMDGNSDMEDTENLDDFALKSDH